MSALVPNFSGIKFAATEVLPKPPDAEPVDLYKFFNAVITNQQLEIDQEHLQQIVSKDLTISTAKLSHQLLCILTEGLTYYMTTWPGWQKSNDYHKGQLAQREWFERFRQYLIFKSNFIIKNAATFEPSLKNTKDMATQTENKDDVLVAPYTLCIGGSPAVLNNIVFMESGGHILIKQHKEKQWNNLVMKEFLNWPYVSVEVSLPDIGFSRSNTHRFQRYIALCSDNNKAFPEVEHISHITKLPNVQGNIQPYTYEFIFCYLTQLIFTLKKIPGVNAERINELQDIFTEYLEDIKEANVHKCTMCTGMSVGYHIGNSKYIRNKKMVSTDSNKFNKNTVNFYEVLVPQVDFTLEYFYAQQDNSDKANISFVNLRELMTKALSQSAKEEMNILTYLINATCIVYHCTFCSKSFSGCKAYQEITEHFLTKHKDEQAMLCLKCCRQFEVKYLVAKRWKHNCG